MMSRLAGLFLLALALAAPAGAQVITPLAGEHADFTRVVVRLPAGTGWSLTPEGRERRFTVTSDTARFDVRGIFARIPRSRLSTVVEEGATLTLALACDCPIRAWEDRPGLVILDISDAPAVVPDQSPAEPAATQPPAPMLPAPRDALATARAAGESLARSRPRPEDEAIATAPEDPRLAALAEDLGRTVASALGQGLLDPAVDQIGPDAGMPDTGILDTGILADAPLPELPANMRVATVLARRDPAEMPPAAAPPRCAGAEVLDRILDQDVTDFGAELGRLSRLLYGEFDQPDAQARLDLIGLYLAAGFGAEARTLLDNAPDPVAGRDFVLGMADVLEDRASNSRMRLAQGVDCGGTVSLMAVLAGADSAGVARNAGQLALGFSALPPALRGLTGVALATAMTDAGAIDEARIVADSLERSDWVSRPELALVQARLDRARNRPGDADARLAAEGGPAPETVQTRLDLAIETEGSLDAAYLANAEALAATTRDTATGPELMAAVIRLHSRSGALPDAFAALDRLESWMATTGANQRLLGALRDKVWAALASNGTDFGVVEAVLARTDWQNAALQAATRLALAQRLLDLGLTTPVAELVSQLDGPEARVLQARRALADGEAEAALALLDGLQTDPARHTRAATLARLADHAGAADEFAALGLTDAESRAAILAGDWRRVEAMALEPAARGATEGPGPTPGAMPDPILGPALGPALGPMLGRPPGHAEVAHRQAAEPGPTEADGNAAPASGAAGGVAATNAAPAVPLPVPSGPANAGVALPGPAPGPAPGAQPAEPETAALAPSVIPVAPVPAPTPPADALSAGTALQPGTTGALGAGASGTDAPGTNAPGTGTSGERGPGPVLGAQGAAATEVLPGDPGAVFDRLGMVSRSSTLLSESERLRDALTPLLAPASPPTN